jgi:hypothetical protein
VETAPVAARIASRIVAVDSAAAFEEQEAIE